MKSSLMLLIVALAITGVASADNCPGLPPLTAAVPIFTGGVTSPVFGSTSFSCGGLTFSNFIGVDAGNDPTPNLALTGATNLGGTVNLTFNPFLGANQDLYLYFNVTGSALSQMGLSVSGQGATVSEQACSSPLTSGNTLSTFSFGINCSGSSNILLGMNALVNSSGLPTAYAGVTGTSQASYIFKDIGTAGAHTAVTAFTESFTPIPEPISMLLMGSGLVALKLRRKKA